MSHPLERGVSPTRAAPWSVPFPPHDLHVPAGTEGLKSLALQVRDFDSVDMAQSIVQPPLGAQKKLLMWPP